MLTCFTSAGRISTGQLSRRFLSVVGRAPGAYLTQWRMDLAARRLRDTDEPLEVIARSVGLHLRLRLQPRPPSGPRALPHRCPTVRRPGSSLRLTTPGADVLVHAGDIRRPLGLAHQPAPDAVRIALEFLTQGRPVGFLPRGRLDRLQLVADDLDWSWGSGPTISGRGIDLLMAACGRPTALHDLTGSGVADLSPRLRT